MYLKDASSLFHICFLDKMISFHVFKGDNTMKMIKTTGSRCFKVSKA